MKRLHFHCIDLCFIPFLLAGDIVGALPELGVGRVLPRGAAHRRAGALARGAGAAVREPAPARRARPAAGRARLLRAAPPRHPHRPDQHAPAG